MWHTIQNSQQLLLDSSEEELTHLSEITSASSSESTIPVNRRGGSVKGRQNAPRNFEEAYQRLWNDYFSESPKYKATTFRRRFRMSRSLFIRIHDAVVQHDSYFVQKRNAAGKWGISSLLKITAAQRVLSTAQTGDLFDEYLQIAQTTATECTIHFVKAVVEVFGVEYLRAPNINDINELLRMNETRGFPGMLGSLDCMHWRWKNCPTGWAGQYTGHIQEPTIILEAVASQDLWIWHAFFGLPGSHNDINVLEYSPIFNTLIEGTAPPVNFSVNGNSYNMGYYLADGIYPQWATLVKTISNPNTPKKQHFAKLQESVRKDVERAFGVLQARWHIVHDPVRFHNKNDLGLIMKACIIMHNMIVEEERGMYAYAKKGNYYLFKEARPPPLDHSPTLDLNRWMENRMWVRNKSVHSQLQRDLVEHLWERLGTSSE